jgi:hypothetical protein
MPRAFEWSFPSRLSSKKFCSNFSSPPCMVHARPILSSLIWSS